MTKSQKVCIFNYIPPWKHWLKSISINYFWFTICVTRAHLPEETTIDQILVQLVRTALCGTCLAVRASLTSFWQLLATGASYKEYALVQVFEEQFYSSLSRLDNIECILSKFATFNQCCYFLPDSFLNPFLSFQFKRPSRRYPILVWHFFFFTIFVCPVILIYCQSLCVL